MAWDHERVAKAKELWNAGHSASQVAAMLGGFAHCVDGGRSAVIGKLHRLGVPGRTKASLATNRGAKRSKKHKPNPPNALKQLAAPPMQAVPLPLPMPTADDKARVSFDDLENHHCRWPVGETRNALPNAPTFCGLRKTPGSPYCPGHHARAFVPVRPRQHPALAEANVVVMRKRETVAA